MNLSPAGISYLRVRNLRTRWKMQLSAHMAKHSCMSPCKLIMRDDKALTQTRAFLEIGRSRTKMFYVLFSTSWILLVGVCRNSILTCKNISWWRHKALTKQLKFESNCSQYKAVILKIMCRDTTLSHEISTKPWMFQEHLLSVCVLGVTITSQGRSL